MFVVNFFGPPGVGKSSCSAGVFWKLKMKNVESELVTEYAKAMVWAERKKALEDTLYLFAKQNHTLEILRNNKITFAISDSPLLLSLIYMPKKFYKNFEPLALEVFHTYNNINFLLTPDPKNPYSEIGRLQNKQESQKIGEMIVELLEKNNIQYKRIVADDRIVDAVLSELPIQI